MHTNPYQYTNAVCLSCTRKAWLVSLFSPHCHTLHSGRDHITPVLRELHWLPVRQQIHFKLGCLMYKSLSGQAPQYLADDVQLVADSGQRRLRSASDRTCVIPRTHNSFKQFRRQKLLCCWTQSMKCSTARTKT